MFKKASNLFGGKSEILHAFEFCALDKIDGCVRACAFLQWKNFKLCLTLVLWWKDEILMFCNKCTQSILEFISPQTKLNANRTKTKCQFE